MAINGGNNAAKGLIIDSKIIHLFLTENEKSFIRMPFGLIIKLNLFFAAVSYKESGRQEFLWAKVWKKF